MSQRTGLQRSRFAWMAEEQFVRSSFFEFWLGLPFMLSMLWVVIGFALGVIIGAMISIPFVNGWSSPIPEVFINIGLAITATPCILFFLLGAVIRLMRRPAHMRRVREKFQEEKDQRRRAFIATYRDDMQSTVGGSKSLNPPKLVENNRITRAAKIKTAWTRGRLELE